MPEFNNGRALVVGVGQYQDQQWNIPVSANDATAVAQSLTDSDVCAYPESQVELLCNEKTTQAGVVNALRRLRDTAKPDDSVLIFFCGHGALGDDGLYYLGTHDAQFKNTRIKAKTGLSAPDLMTLLRGIEAKKLLLILNSCYSGNVNPALGADQEVGEAEAFGAPAGEDFKASVLATGEGRAIITASRPSQKSYYQHNVPLSFFGQALVDGLRGKDLQTNSAYIGLFELYEFIWRKVKAGVAQTFDLVQEPMLTLLQNAGPYPVAYYHGGAGGSLGIEDIRKKLPEGVPLDELPKSVVQNVFNVQTGVINLAPGAQIGTIIAKNIVQGNLVEINFATSRDQAAAADGRQDLLRLIQQLREDAARLSQAGAPAGNLVDVDDDLRKAKEAGEQGDTQRLLEKLESAQRIVLALAGRIPAAVKLGETIGVVLQRAVALWK